MKAIRLSLILLAVALALIGCANPQVSTPSTPAGSLQGQALLVGKADNSGIVISAELTDGIRSLSVQRALSGRSLGEKAIAASTTTSASGAYTLSNLSPGTYVITASSKDSLEKAVTASVAVVAAQTTQVVTLCLTLPGQISGKAILSDAAAQPSGSLGIVVFIAGTSFSAMTASDGTYLISNIPPGKNYTLVASKVGYDSPITTANVAVLQTTAMATLSLAKTATATATGSLSGTALLSDGPPHSGIFVYLPQTSCITVTGPSGSFNLTGVPPGAYPSLVASKEGYTSSDGTSVTVSAGSNFNIGSPLSLSVIPKEVAAPTFSPSTGTFNTDQLVTIYDATLGASIYYTLDGTAPTTSSAVYGAPIPVAGNGTVATIKAIAAKSGMTTSASVQGTYTINYNAVSPPQFSPSTGTFNTDQLVTISDGTPGATIYYSIATGGAAPPDPTAASTAYTGPIPVAGNGTVATITAIAAKAGMTTSAVGQSTYTINYSAVSSPQFSPSTGTFNTDQLVSIYDATPGATIYYTTDGTTPGTSSAIYSAPIPVVGNGTMATITAIAAKAGMTTSAMAQSTISIVYGGAINLGPAATPTFSPAGGTYTRNQSVSLSCATAGASIYYTTDGTDPTWASTPYPGPIIVAGNGTAMTIKAIATAPLFSQSAVGSATYSIVASLEMISIPAGSFDNGISTVTLSAFRMAKYDITQTLYQSVTGMNPSYFAFNSDAATCPVEQVTWYDAVEFCNKLSETDGLTPVYYISERKPSWGYPITSATVFAAWTNSGYRLPTEAQWEYAARAGTTTTYYWGNVFDDATVGQYAWFSPNSGSKTHAVGQKLPNAFGLYDMAGNIWQWCWDWYGTYPSGSQTDPTGASSGTNRVIRGGSWRDLLYKLSPSYRLGYMPYYQDGNIGFRVVAP